MKTPRSGTRVRAVFDALQDGKEHRWSELAIIYGHAYLPWSNQTYVGLTLSRILKKYAKRVRRGVYVAKKLPELIPNPFAHVIIRHTGAEPNMDDKCGTCGEAYGNHYGDVWPALTDCPVMDVYGPKRTEPGQKMRYWSPQKEKAVEPLPPFDNAYIGKGCGPECSHPAHKGSPEIEDMAWGYKSGAPLSLEREMEVAMLEARNENLQRDFNELYALSDSLSRSIHDKITYIGQLEKKLVEVAERSTARQKLIDETKDLNLLYQSRLENGKTAIDTARGMLSEIAVGSLSEAISAIDALDAQLSGTYGVLDGTMDE